MSEVIGGQSHRVQQKTLGLIGGMSWRSTALYYERLNLAIERVCGPHHGFRGQIANLDYADLLRRIEAGDMDGIRDRLSCAAEDLSRSGCEVIVLTAVTAHLWFDDVCQISGVAVPHVLAAVARELDNISATSVGVLGTQATCGAPFLRERLGACERNVIVLDPEAQAEIDRLIQTILTQGGAEDEGRLLLAAAVAALSARGAECVVLACTELPLLLPLQQLTVPLIDSVALHVEDICEHILTEAL